LAPPLGPELIDRPLTWAIACSAGWPPCPCPRPTMLIRQLQDCPEFVAGDGTQLRELLHPDKQDLALGYSLAHAILPVGQVSTPHALTTSEVYYILSGTGEMYIDAGISVVGPGDAIYIPPNARQYLRNNGSEPIVFICIVDPAWRAEDETVFDPV
jgi:mannose-6-phosphate isomerase-like protein (cupin superfamily)